MYVMPLDFNLYLSEQIYLCNAVVLMMLYVFDKEIQKEESSNITIEIS